MNHTSKSTEREAAGETYKCFSMPRFSAASCAHGTNMSCKMHTGGVDGTTLAQAPLLIDGTCASYKGHSTLNQYLHHGTCDGQRSLDESYGRSGLYPAGEDPGDGPFALTRKTPYPHGSFRAGTVTAPARPSTSGCGQALRRQSKQHICKNEYCMSVGLSQCSSTRSPFLHNTNLHPTRTPTIYTTLV